MQFANTDIHRFLDASADWTTAQTGQWTLVLMAPAQEGSQYQVTQLVPAKGRHSRYLWDVYVSQESFKGLHWK